MNRTASFSKAGQFCAASACGEVLVLDPAKPEALVSHGPDMATTEDVTVCINNQAFGELLTTFLVGIPTQETQKTPKTKPSSCVLCRALGSPDSESA